MKNPQRFYTYAYLRKDRTPYYIGKGQRDRAYSKNHINISVPPKDRILFLKKNLLEEEAFNHEKYMIAVFGRKDLETGILHNRTEGGDGTANISDITKEKMRLKKLGKPLSQKHKDKLSEVRKGNMRWNNGIKEKLCKECPGDGWVLGRIISNKVGVEYGKWNIGRKATPETLKKLSNRSIKYEYTIQSPDENIFITNNMKKFCEEHNLTARLMTSVARGKYTNHKGWKVVTVEELDKKV
jgi:hypothetical protein